MGFNRVGVSIGNGVVLIGVAWAVHCYARHVKDAPNSLFSRFKANVERKVPPGRYTAGLSARALYILVRGPLGVPTARRWGSCELSLQCQMSAALMVSCLQVSRQLLPCIVMDLRPNGTVPEWALCKRSAGANGHIDGPTSTAWLRCGAEKAATALRDRLGWTSVFASGPQYPGSTELVIVVTEDTVRCAAGVTWQRTACSATVMHACTALAALLVAKMQLVANKAASKALSRLCRAPSKSSPR